MQLDETYTRPMCREQYKLSDSMYTVESEEQRPTQTRSAANVPESGRSLSRHLKKNQHMAESQQWTNLLSMGGGAKTRLLGGRGWSRLVQSL